MNAAYLKTIGTESEPMKKMEEQVKRVVQSMGLSQNGSANNLNTEKEKLILLIGTSPLKIVVANMISKELHLNLHRIDLQTTIKKDIGETEKNLSRLFDSAEESGAILFFDEADALFGKRGNIVDSHCKYENLNLNYFLRMVEEFAGICILSISTDMNIEKSIVGKVHTIEFPFPPI